MHSRCTDVQLITKNLQNCAAKLSQSLFGKVNSLEPLKQSFTEITTIFLCQGTAGAGSSLGLECWERQGLCYIKRGKGV